MEMDVALFTKTERPFLQPLGAKAAVIRASLTILRPLKPAHGFHFAFTPSSSWICSSADSRDSSFPLIALF